MNRTKRITMTVHFDVTPPQAVALESMFEYWNQLGSMGSSREVGFYVDGDGNFKPNCRIVYTEHPLDFNRNMEISSIDLKKSAVVKDNDGNRIYDFDPVAWNMHSKEERK